MPDTPKASGVIKPSGAHTSTSRRLTYEEALEAHFRRKAEIKARAERDGDAFRAEIRARQERERFIGPPYPRGT